MKYRKKPIIVEAFKFDGDLRDNDGYYVPDWAVEAFENGILYFDGISYDDPPYDLFIRTHEGSVLVNFNDYVIKGINDELCCCDPDIFEKSYDLVESEK